MRLKTVKYFLLNSIKNREIQKIYSQWSYVLNFLLKHCTFAKIINAFLIELQYRLKRIKVSGFPYFVIIDTSNKCNLHCPQCPTGMKINNRTKKVLPIKEYKTIFNVFKNKIFFVVFSNWGEPFLNPDIFKIIRYTQDNNVGTIVSTNFSLEFSGDEISAIVDSGLERLIVSIDGASKESYLKYRIGGNFDRVCENLKRVVKRKRELASKTPIIQWQFIANKFNEHEIEFGKKIASDIGVNIFTFYTRFKVFDHLFTYDNTLAKEWNPRHNKHLSIDYSMPYIINSSCPNLWKSMTINPDGKVSPCCAVWDTATDFGDINDGFSNVWNNKKYRVARGLFINRKFDKSDTVVCKSCRIYKKNLLKSYYYSI